MGLPLDMGGGPANKGKRPYFRLRIKNLNCPDQDEKLQIYFELGIRSFFGGPACGLGAHKNHTPWTGEYLVIPHIPISNQHIEKECHGDWNRFWPLMWLHMFYWMFDGIRHTVDLTRQSSKSSAIFVGLKQFAVQLSSMLKTKCHFWLGLLSCHNWNGLQKFLFWG